MIQKRGRPVITVCSRDTQMLDDLFEDIEDKIDWILIDCDVERREPVLEHISVVIKKHFGDIMTQVGIKETKEVVRASFVVAALLISKLKDGVQLSDLMEVFAQLSQNEVFKRAIEDIQAVPAEVVDLSLVEGVELAKVVLEELPGLVEAFKK